jgi:hypothetical protein
MMIAAKTAPENDAYAPAVPGACAPTAPVTPLEFEGQAVRMSVDESGNPWWVAHDVCAILGLDNVSLAVNGRADRPESGLPDDEKRVAIVNTPGGSQEMVVVNEPGVYVRTYPESVLRDYFGDILDGEANL